jgi:hypothetical protein
VFGVKGLLLDLEDEQTMSWAIEGEQRDRDPDAEEETVDLAELSDSDEPEVMLSKSIRLILFDQTKQLFSFLLPCIC